MMSRIVVLIAVLVVALMLGAPEASAGDNGGYSLSFKWFRDDDGDGIPNGQDDDWVAPADGTGYGLRHGCGIVLPGMYISTTGEGNYLRKQKRFRNNRTDNPGDSVMEHKRLRDGSCL